MQRTCPRCALDLVNTNVEWVASCGRCGGIFAARTVGPLPSTIGETALAASDRAAIRPATTAAAACPVCRKTMARETFRAIEVDRCAAHGIWFDRDEVNHVMSRTKPATIKGLGGLAAGAASAASAEALLGRPANLSGHEAIDLADVGLEAALPAIHADVEQSDAAAWMVVAAVAGLFET